MDFYVKTTNQSNLNQFN